MTFSLTSFLCLWRCACIWPYIWFPLSLRRAREAGNSSGTRNKVLQATSLYYLPPVSQHSLDTAAPVTCQLPVTHFTHAVPLSLSPTFHNAYFIHTAEGEKPLSYLSCHRFTARQCTTLPTPDVQVRKPPHSAQTPIMCRPIQTMSLETINSSSPRILLLTIYKPCSSRSVRSTVMLRESVCAACVSSHSRVARARWIGSSLGLNGPGRGRLLQPQIRLVTRG